MPDKATRRYAASRSACSVIAFRTEVEVLAHRTMLTPEGPARPARTPQAGELTIDKDRARPAEHGPESLRSSRVVDQQRAVPGLQEQVEGTQQSRCPYWLRGELAGVG